MHSYEVRPTKDGAKLISEQLPFGKLLYGGPSAAENAIDYAQFYSRTHATEVRVYDATGALVATHAWDARTATDLVI